MWSPTNKTVLVQLADVIDPAEKDIISKPAFTNLAAGEYIEGFLDTCAGQQCWFRVSIQGSAGVEGLLGFVEVRGERCHCWKGRWSELFLHAFREQTEPTGCSKQDRSFYSYILL